MLAMLARWEVAACGLLALCGALAHTTVPSAPAVDPTAWPPTPPPWDASPAPAADCGQPSHRPVAMDTYAATWITRSFMEENALSLRLHNYTAPHDVILSNDGDSVYVDFPNMSPEDAPHIDWAVNGTVVWVMRLTRLSFHWPSEHPIDGVKSFLELHMEHTDDEGLTWILAYNYDICEPPALPRSGFNLISTYARNISAPGSSTAVPGFVPQSLMPYGTFDYMDMCDYFVYEFSESPTYKQCAPTVLWIVYHHPQCVSREQMDVNLQDQEGGTIVHLDEPLPLVEGVPASYITCF